MTRSVSKSTARAAPKPSGLCADAAGPRAERVRRKAVRDLAVAGRAVNAVHGYRLARVPE